VHNVAGLETLETTIANPKLGQPVTAAGADGNAELNDPWDDITASESINLADIATAGAWVAFREGQETHTRLEDMPTTSSAVYVRVVRGRISD